MPVSAFAGDPYAKQHGIDVEAGAGDENLPEFQKAMLQDAQTRTMEIKLDPGRDTLGVQQAKVMPEVSEDSVRRILETVQEAPADAPPEPEDMEEISSVRVVSDEPEEEKPVGEFDDVSSFSEEKQAELEEIDRLKASREEFKAEYLKLIQHFMDDAQNSFPADLMASTPVGSAASPAVTVPAEPLPVADPVVPVADPFAPIDNFAADDLD